MAFLRVRNMIMAAAAKMTYKGAKWHILAIARKGAEAGANIFTPIFAVGVALAVVIGLLWGSGCCTSCHSGDRNDGQWLHVETRETSRTPGNK